MITLALLSTAGLIAYIIIGSIVGGLAWRWADKNDDYTNDERDTNAWVLGIGWPLTLLLSIPICLGIGIFNLVAKGHPWKSWQNRVRRTMN